MNNPDEYKFFMDLKENEISELKNKFIKEQNDNIHKNETIAELEKSIREQEKEIKSVVDKCDNYRNKINELQKELKELEELKVNSPKYKIGQKVYFMDLNQIYSRCITLITITENNIIYGLNFSSPNSFNENQLFATIQDLLDDLASQEIKEL